LKFDANVNPLSMGETKLDVHAQASLAATITISNFLGKTFSVDVLNAKADIHAERCTVRDDDTQFTVLGGDFIDDDSPFIFNTSEGKYADETKKCNDAVGKFITFSNRAKKAFRDAQQLLTQYRSLQNGVHFDGLCQQLMGAFGDLDVPLFPGGTACPANEPSEVTINRFLDYYQAPGFGQITAFRQAMSELTTATANLKKALSLSKRFDIADPGRSESENIASVQFAIGPIPMTLQIDTFYGYGVAGGFEFELTFPFDPLNVQVGQKDEIAHVKAGVMPHANAGLSAFVGAGGGLGGFNATLGIEGALTLGEIRAPIFAGAGVGAEVTQDLRPTPAALQAPVSAPVDAALSSLGLDSMTHFGIPTAFKFYVWYDYGAALDVQNVLSGEINARLRIKFFFFSRTWRKRIVKFNGWSFHFPLVAGKVGSDPGVGVKTETIDAKNSAQTSAPSVEGTSNMGLGEAQTTLPVLAAVEVPATAPTGTVTPFDNSQMKGAFYDNLCCSKPGEACPLPGQEPTATSAPCCPGESCKSNSTDPTAPGACVVACKNQGAACTTAQDCCDAPPNQNNVVATCDTDTNTCGTCINPGGSCKQDSDCCGGSGPNQFASCVDGAFCELNL
jgi:hypothetical protein